MRIRIWSVLLLCLLVDCKLPESRAVSASSPVCLHPQHSPGPAVHAPSTLHEWMNCFPQPSVKCCLTLRQSLLALLLVRKALTPTDPHMGPWRKGSKGYHQRAAPFTLFHVGVTMGCTNTWPFLMQLVFLIFTRLEGQGKGPEGKFEGPLRTGLANESVKTDFSHSALK